MTINRPPMCLMCGLPKPVQPGHGVIVVPHVNLRGLPCRDGYGIGHPYHSTSGPERAANLEQLLTDVESW